MNSRLWLFTIKGVIRRWKSICKVALAVFFSFVFVTGILLFQENMYNWQVVKAKEHFGNWFVMDVSRNQKEKEVLTSFPYLEKAVTAKTVNEVYDRFEESTGIKIGNMSQDFIKKNNITVEKGTLPNSKDEIAIDWNSLLKINQGYDIGDNIELIFKDSNSETGFSKRTYKLSGILTSYTSVWVKGKVLPGVIVYDEELIQISDSEYNIFCYSLKNYIKEDDHRLIYDRICEDSKGNNAGYFNNAVYEIKPWGNQLLYQYMYIIIMIIGVASITYQVLLYNRGRKNIRDIHRQLGAGRGQLFLMYLIENTFIMAVSAVLGIAVTIVLGKVICDNVLTDGSINFYTVGIGIGVKIIITFLVAVVFSNVIYMFSGKEKKRASKRKIRKIRKSITYKNIAAETSRRFIRNNGLILNVSIRLFSAVMAAVMLLCILSVNSAYSSYVNNNSDLDLIGYGCEDKSTNYYYYYYQKDQDKVSEDIKTNKNPSILEKYENCRATDISETEFKYFSMRQIEMTKKIKCGRTGLYNGLSQETIDKLQDINGVKNISYGYFETVRSWYWDNCDLAKLGADEYYHLESQGGIINSGNNGKYLFASEYVDVNKEIYNLVMQYDEQNDISYDAFKSGKESIVFLDTNSSGVYDDTMKAGITLKLHNYYNVVNRLNGYAYHNSDSKYSTAIENYAYENVFLSNEYQENHTDLKHSMSYRDLVDYWIPKLTKDEIIELLSEYNGDNGFYMTSDLDAINSLCEKLKNDEMTLDEMYKFIKPYAFDYLLSGSYFNKLMYQFYQVPAASTKVAKVIILNDEIKNAFKQYIPEFGQYTMLASKELANQALENQNELTKKYFRLEELPEDLTLKLEPNQISITYGLSSAFTATNNIVSSYLSQSGFLCNSYSEQKDQLKQKTIESMILYGFSGLAALIVYILVSMVVVLNRMDRNKNNLSILKQTGANKSTLIKICMIECIRENIWCIVVLPIMIVIDFIIISRRV